MAVKGFVALGACPTEEEVATVLFVALASWYKMGTRTSRCAACAMLEASISAANWRFHLFRRFWNHIFTWVSVNRNEAASEARSEEERYRFISKVVSSWNTCDLENTVRVFFLRLTFESCPFTFCPPELPPAVIEPWWPEEPGDSPSSPSIPSSTSPKSSWTSSPVDGLRPRCSRSSDGLSSSSSERMIIGFSTSKINFVKHLYSFSTLLKIFLRKYFESTKKNI